MRHALSLATAMLWAANVQAQSRLFVDGALSASQHGSPTGTIAVGVHLSPRYDIRVESEFASWDTTRDASCDRHACLELNIASRTNSIAVLAARRFGLTRRLGLHVLGGLGMLANGLDSSGYYDTLAADGTVASHFAHDNRAVEHYAGLTLGLDAEIAVAQRIAVVPRWRAHSYIGVWYESGFSNAGIGLRCRF